MSKRNKFNLKKEYEKAWNYLGDSKKFIWIALGIFTLFILIGYFVSLPNFLNSKILDFIQNILSKTEGMSCLQLIKFIFFNNIQSSFVSMIFGILLGIPTILIIISNGFILGFVFNMSVQSKGILSLWRIFPHGVFELPAMIISFSLGLRLGFSIFNKKDFEKFKDNLYSSLKVFILFVIPLLIIAAIIEGTLIFLRV